MRFIPNAIDRAKWRNTLTYQVTPRFSVGVEYNPLAGKVSPLANFVALTETEKRPAIILGHEFRPHRNAVGTIVLRDGEQESGTRNKAADCAIHRSGIRHLRKSASRHRRIKYLFAKKFQLDHPFRRCAGSSDNQLHSRTTPVRSDF